MLPFSEDNQFICLLFCCVSKLGGHFERLLSARQMWSDLFLKKKKAESNNKFYCSLQIKGVTYAKNKSKFTWSVLVNNIYFLNYSNWVGEKRRGILSQFLKVAWVWGEASVTLLSNQPLTVSRLCQCSFFLVVRATSNNYCFQLNNSRHSLPRGKNDLGHS